MPSLQAVFREDARLWQGIKFLGLILYHCGVATDPKYISLFEEDPKVNYMGAE